MTSLRFFILILGTCLVVALSLTMVRLWGVGQAFVAYDNKFLTPPTPWLVTPWQSREADGPSPQNLILLAQVSQNEQGLLVIDGAPGASLAQPLTLGAFLAQIPTQRLILNVVSNRAEIHELLAKNIREAEGSRLADERIMIQSDYDNVLISLKDLLPRLVYGSTASDTMRFKTYQGLWLLPAVPFKGDVFFSPLNLAHLSPQAGTRKAFTAEMGAELHRRLKKIILGPVSTREEVALALSLGADGLISDKPNWLAQILSAPH